MFNFSRAFFFLDRNSTCVP